MMHGHGKSESVIVPVKPVKPANSAGAPSTGRPYRDRREFIMLLGGGRRCGRSRRGRSSRSPVIGFLHAQSPDTYANRLRGFHRGLKDAGYVEGENVTIGIPLGSGSSRSATGAGGRINSPESRGDRCHSRYGSGLGRQSGNHDGSHRIPRRGNPVQSGIVASLARPGGNLTGINFFNAELNAKRLEILQELVPAATRITILVNPAFPLNAETTLRGVEPAARDLGLQINVLNASTSREIDAAFATLGHERPDALFVGGDSLFNNRRLQLALLAARHGIPTSYASRDYPKMGGLMSYGANVTDAFRQVGAYTGRILKGAKPADLPVVQASKFELVINAQTARVLGMTVLPTLLARADEVIE